MCVLKEKNKEGLTVSPAERGRERGDWAEHIWYQSTHTHLSRVTTLAEREPEEFQLLHTHTQQTSVSLPT